MNKNEIELKNQFKLLIALLLFSSIIDAQCLSGDCTNGIGIWKDATGITYKGEFKNGTITGEGVLTFPEKIDRGPFDEGFIKEILVYEGAKTYEGELSIGEPNGKGLLEFYSGQKIECLWEGGDPIGNAIWSVRNSLVG